MRLFRIANPYTQMRSDYKSNRTGNKRTILIPKELATQFNITTKTARTDLQDLVEMGYLLATNINKRAMGYIKSDRFDELIKATLNKKQGK